ncbi:MAG: TIGR02757 family protein [Thermoanaerobaculia bacterium]
MRRRKPVRAELLRQRLDELVATFDVSTIEPDPLQLVLRFDDPLDQEVAGLIAAAFAYGRADIIVANIGVVLARMKPSPFRYLQTLDRSEATKRFAGFAHRFHKTPDLVDFLLCLARVIDEHGSIGALFEQCYDADAPDIAPSLSRFVRSVIPSGVEGPGRAGRQARASSPTRPGPSLDARDDRALRYLLTDPQDGSACKRMNLFLRWMVRRTPPDLGLWTFVDPAKLVIPLDTHVHRIATFLGLSERKSGDWKTARALTDTLVRFDAADPVRYDFALCRLGILDLCSRRQKKENCDVCLLRDVCRFPVV